MQTPLCCWLLAVSLALAPGRSEACLDYTPPPLLGKQIAEAQAIVVARVEALGTEPLLLDTGESGLHVWVQQLRVVRVLKGSAPAQFRVSTGGYAEEAQAFRSVQDDHRARVFFVREQEEPREGELPQVFAEELQVEDVEDVAVFLDRIDEAVQLQAKHASSAELREWRVRCAMHRATRGHAVHELLSESRRLPRAGEPPLAEELTREQRRAIMDGFRQEPSTDGTFVAVLALARGVVHPAFDRVAVGAMETLLAEPDGALSAEVPQAMYLLMERLGVPDVEARWAGARPVAGQPQSIEELQLVEDPAGDEDFARLLERQRVEELARFEAGVEADRRLRALWEALRAEGYLVPAPQVPYARSAVDRIGLSVD